MYLMRIKYQIGCRLTHTVTHTPKKADGINGHKSTG